MNKTFENLKKLLIKRHDEYAKLYEKNLSFEQSTGMLNRDCDFDRGMMNGIRIALDLIDEVLKGEKNEN